MAEMTETITIPKAKLAAIIKQFGKPLESGEGFILSVPIAEFRNAGNLEVIPADGADGFAISYIAHTRV
jgi:hypothetical protein